MSEARTSGGEPLAVLCRNLYLGADFKVLFPEGTEPPLGEIVAGFYDRVEETRYPERARALAVEIHDRLPDVVCLQEVFRYQVQGPVGDLLEDLDFLAVLQRELESLGTSYRVAGVAPASDEWLPIHRDGEEGRFRIHDRDVILVKPGIEVEGAGYLRFAAKIDRSLPNDDHPERVRISVRRAYGWVRLRWREKDLHVVNTHLESMAPAVRRTQTRELLDTLDAVMGPVVLAGDLNAEPDGVTYRMLTRSFTDPFAAPNGETFGAGPELRDDPLELEKRIDHVLTRGGRWRTELDRFGHRPEERTPSGLWPSDHAGLLLRLA